MKPTKKDIKKVLELNSDILKLIPSGDSMFDMYHKMHSRLTERLELYDQFLENPYKAASRAFKLNSDESLELGDYLNNDDRVD